jgi:hypothetical protein
MNIKNTNWTINTEVSPTFSIYLTNVKSVKKRVMAKRKLKELISKFIIIFSPTKIKTPNAKYKIPLNTVLSEAKLEK